MELRTMPYDMQVSQLVLLSAVVFRRSVRPLVLVDSLWEQETAERAGNFGHCFACQIRPRLLEAEHQLPVERLTS